MSGTVPMRGLKFPDSDTVYEIPVVDDSLSVEGAAADALQTGTKLAAISEQLRYMPEGISVNYRINTPGWKRVMTTMRIHGGQLNFALSRNDNRLGRIFQNVGVQYGAYVDYPNAAWDNVVINDVDYGVISNEHPVLYQLFNNIFGEDIISNPARRSTITRVRFGYPKPGTAINNGLDIVNPVNCYIDVYVDFDECDYLSLGREDSGVQFQMQFGGKTYNYGCEPILEETDAADVGLYEEELQFYEFSLTPHYGMVINERDNYIRTLTSRNLKKETMSTCNLYELVDIHSIYAIEATLDESTTLRVSPRTKYNHIFVQPDLYVPGSDHTVAGVSVHIQEDGGVKLNGTATSSGVVKLTSEGYDGRYAILPAGKYRIHGGQFQWTGYDTNGNVDKASGYSYGTGHLIPGIAESEYIDHTTGPIMITRVGVYIKSGTVFDNVVYPYICTADGREADISVTENGFYIKGSRITKFDQFYSVFPSTMTGEVGYTLAIQDDSLSDNQSTVNPVDSVFVYKDTSTDVYPATATVYVAEPVATKADVPSVFWGDGTDIDDSLGKLGDIYVVV